MSGRLPLRRINLIGLAESVLFHHTWHKPFGPGSRLGANQLLPLARCLAHWHKVKWQVNWLACNKDNLLFCRCALLSSLAGNLRKQRLDRQVAGY